MKNIDNLCMGCFEELTNGCVCEHCGYDNDSATEIIYLQPKTMLDDRYVIGKLISHESDAATYMAYDSKLDTVVTIREFLPKNIASRLEGNLDIHIRERYRDSFDKLKQSFIKLWTTLSLIKNLSAVIPTTDVFELNGTAYAVSNHIDYIPLREFLLRNPDGNIDWEQARIMFMPVLTTLEALHSHDIIHGGICPENLVLCRDGKIRLKSFCITEANNISSPLEFNINEGYTAIEQYENSHKMCPATDIYAFSACIFRALVGQNPPDAKSREANDKLMIPNAIAEKIPTHVIKALGCGLQIYPENRTSDVSTFRDLLNASPSVVAASASDIDNNQEIEYDDNYVRIVDNSKPKSFPKAIIVILIILIIGACVAGYFVAQNGGFGKKEPDETPSENITLQTFMVPDFKSAGYTQSDIENSGAWNKQFKFKFVGEYSIDVEEGIIFEQSVPAGETVDEGTEIILKVSKGVQTEKIPDVGGLSLEEATKKLTDAGFKVSTVEIYNNDGHTPNTVKSTDGIAPRENTVVALGTEVILQVYGEQVETTSAPADTDAQ